MAKVFQFEGRTIELAAPETINLESAYENTIYTTLFNQVAEGNLFPQIDCDKISEGQNGFDPISLANSCSIQYGAISAKTTNPERARRAKALVPFLQKHPIFFGFMQNMNVPAEVSIDHAQVIIDEKCSAENFIRIKKVIDEWNKMRWTRERDTSEGQSGVSNLGTISEALLETALSSYVDDTNFFKNNTSAVQSYGDFVLMCLPNNLWLSVKSNFARERLLASGFTTDILGVGFFTDANEFTSGAKLRNFQKVGFLAMYVPDIPITEIQVTNDVSTFEEIEHFYTSHDNPLPLNINGKPFIRRLSDLHKDIGSLLSETNIKRRVTIGF